MDITNQKIDKFWIESPSQCPSYERNLNFASLVSEDDDYSFSKKKVARDPMSHRIIEKRRRDRMNNCLADLSRLLPPACMKKGRGRIEKTEIIEMTIKHMKHLQIHACKEIETCEIAARVEQSSNNLEQYKQGFTECIAEMLQFLSQGEGYYSGDDFCNRLVNHLQNHCDKIVHADAPLSESTGSQSEFLVLNGNGSGSLNDEERIGSVMSISPTMERRSRRSEEDTESLNEEREQAMFNYLQAEAGSDADHSSFRNTTGSCSGADSDEFNTSLKRNSTGNNSGTISPENRDGFSSGDVDSSSTTSQNSSQLREMLLGAVPGNSSSSSSYGRGAKSSSSSSSSSRNCNTDDSNSMYKFKTDIHQRFTADLEHVYSPTTDVAIRQHQPDQLSNTNSARHTTKFSGKAVQGLKRKKTSHAERSSSTPKSGDASVESSVNGSVERQPKSHPQSATSAFQESNGLSKHLETAIVGTALKPAKAESSLTEQPTENVPIFALHPKGTYYIPMSIELALIGSLFNPPSADPATEEAILHPVTISVNFCHPIRLLTQRPADLIPSVIPQQHRRSSSSSSRPRRTIGGGVSTASTGPAAAAVTAAAAADRLETMNTRPPSLLLVGLI
uniref:EOG090X0J7Y n=1 Tax=Evadne anonyx TaxID=141404 RepID=A0A9N6ZFC0_9CRUS|nr:EOG090X0J7Y [Evadne anonyx]